MSNGPFLYPNVTSLPGQSGIGQSERLPKKQDGVKGEFDQVFEKVIGDRTEKANGAEQDLSNVKAPLKFSAHASQRLKDRKIALDSATMMKVNDALDKAEAKGIEDTLVLTKDAALIVSVKNRTVITAMDRSSMTGNVFTNIDGAVIV
jgi:flagellar operon protein